MVESQKIGIKVLVCIVKPIYICFDFTICL